MKKNQNINQPAFGRTKFLLGRICKDIGRIVSYMHRTSPWDVRITSQSDVQGRACVRISSDSDVPFDLKVCGTKVIVVL